MSKNKRTVTHAISAEGSRVGMFWLLPQGKLIVDSVSLDEAEAYGDSLTHRRGHVDHWEQLQKTGIVDPDTEYSELPRGRVG